MSNLYQRIICAIVALDIYSQNIFYLLYNVTIIYNVTFPKIDSNQDLRVLLLFITSTPLKLLCFLQRMTQDRNQLLFGIVKSIVLSLKFTFKLNYPRADYNKPAIRNTVLSLCWHKPSLFYTL